MGSLLRAPSGQAVYINRYVAPARFAKGEVDREIDRLSGKFSERADIRRSGAGQGRSQGIIASWGEIRLDQLDDKAMGDLQNGRPVGGLLIDYLGDFRRSAKEKLPVFRLVGGAGFVWAATYDEGGNGSLRFLTANPTSFAPQQVQLTNAANPPAITPVASAVPPPPQKLSDAPYQATGGRAVVTVKGYGPTPEDARKDAVRAALQRTMQQLIVVDRVIKDDQLVRDKIMSTMNGYVESVKELSVNKDGDRFVLEADVTVSATRITNFLGSYGSVASVVDGNSLLAESQREISQREARGELFDRLFRGFPSEAIQARLIKIAPSEKDPSVFAVDIEAAFSEKWVAQLVSGLNALSTESRLLAGAGTMQGCLSGALTCWNNLKSDAARYAQSTSDSSEERSRGPDRPQVRYACVSTDGRQNCFILPAGNYGSSIKYGVDRPLAYIAVRFVDQTGASAHLNDEACVIRPIGNVGMLATFDRRDGHFHLDTSTIEFRIGVNSASLDAKRVTRAVLLPFFMPSGSSSSDGLISHGGYASRATQLSQNAVTDVLESAAPNVCGAPLDDLVLKSMSTKQQGKT